MVFYDQDKHVVYVDYKIPYSIPAPSRYSQILWLTEEYCRSAIFLKTSTRIIFDIALTAEICAHYALGYFFHVEGVLDDLDYSRLILSKKYFY